MNRLTVWKSTLGRSFCVTVLASSCAAASARGAESYSAFAKGAYLSNTRAHTMGVYHGDMLIYDTPYSPRQVANGYALFDLGALDVSAARNVSSGNLVLTATGPTNANDQNPETFLVRDVGVNLNDILRPPQGYSTYEYVTYPGNSSTMLGIWSDFANGTVYAEGSFTPEGWGTGHVWRTYSYPLSAQAIADINTAAGTVMGMGFHPTSGRAETFRANSVSIVLNRFNDPVSSGGGIDFQLDDADISGQGTVDVTPLGVQHHLSSIATGSQMSDSAFSEVRRRFRFESAGENTLVSLLGHLDGLLEAIDGSASVDAKIELFDTTSGSLIDQDRFLQPFGPIGGTLEQLPVNEHLSIEADLVPGEVYEIISRIELSTSVMNEFGQASARFDNTFDVQLVGVPEPSSFLLAAVGLLCLVAYRRRRPAG